MTLRDADLPYADCAPDSRRRRRMQAFHPVVRDRIEVLTADSAAVEDLADSYPALLFAAATGYGTPAGRSAALSLVAEGAPLKHAAEAIGLAFWTRRLPAQAFTEPLHKLPDTAAFNERITSFLPVGPEQARTWLWTVGYGAEACNPGFALWAASWASRQRRTFDTAISRDHFRYLTAWAWHADQPELPGHALLRRPWAPQTGLRRALDELAVWRRRLRLAMSLGKSFGEPWIEDGEALGFKFVALRTTGDFIAESQAMDNCLDQFSDRLEAGRSFVYSVRRDGRPVADLEIGSDDPDAGMPTIQQLRGPRNRRASPEVWRATYTWLGARPLRPVMPLENSSAGARRTARAYWQPYLAAVPPRIADELIETLSADLGFSLVPKRAPSQVRRTRPGRTRLAVLATPIRTRARA